MKHLVTILLAFFLLGGRQELGARNLPGFPELSETSLGQVPAGKLKKTFFSREKGNFAAGRNGAFLVMPGMPMLLTQPVAHSTNRRKADLLTRIIRSNLKLSFRISSSLILKISYL